MKLLIWINHLNTHEKQQVYTFNLMLIYTDQQSYKVHISFYFCIIHMK